MVNKSYMLKSTFSIIKEKVDNLENKLKKEIPEQIQQAYETGGHWHDNPHWDGMIADQAKLGEQLKQLLSFLHSPVFIEELKTDVDKITIGKEVEVLDIATGKKERLRIVGSIDVQFNEQSDFVSYLTPLCKPLLGKYVGDEEEIRTPGGMKKVKIIKIKSMF